MGRSAKGLTWAAGWAPIGALVGLVVAVAIGGVPVGVVVVRYVALFAVLGLVGGGIFSTVLSLTEGRRRFDELSLPRFAAWGALGGLLLGGLAVMASILGAGITPLGAVIAGTSTLLGAGSAAGSLALARSTDDRQLLEVGEDIADVGLTAEEARELLGRTGRGP